MSIKKVDEAWNDFKPVIKSKYNNKKDIGRFKNDIEQVVIPKLKEINIDVDANSANTMSNGEVSYEAIADDQLITISFQSTNTNADSPNDLVAEMFTMTGEEYVGQLDLNNLEETKEMFLDAAEKLGLDLTDEDDRQKAAERKKAEKEQKKQEKKDLAQKAKTGEVKDEIPLPPEEPEEQEDAGRPLLDVYKDAINAYRKTGKLNNQMSIMVENVKKPGSYSLITCYYVGNDRCLAQCNELRLDNLTNFTTLGKYLVDLTPMYKTSVITVYDDKNNEVFSDEVNDEIGGENNG